MNVLFLLFSSVTILSSVAVISSRNPVHSVLFLILAFVNASGIFVLAGAEFLAMILLIVYVGAVAVLFLFVVMMLNISIEEFKVQVKKYFYSGLLVGAILFGELIFSFTNFKILQSDEKIIKDDKLTNTHKIGQIIYTEYFFVFQLSGCILLVAMIGAIVLTLRKRDGVLRQNISKQLDRRKEDSLEIIKVKKN